MQALTYKAKDVSDGRNENHQRVGASQQNHSDDGVTEPAEFFIGAQEMGDRGTNLHKDRHREVILHELLFVGTHIF